eukprot:308171-Rhodomonas_salina.5
MPEPFFILVALFGVACVQECCLLRARLTYTQRHRQTQTDTDRHRQTHADTNDARSTSRSENQTVSAVPSFHTQRYLAVICSNHAHTDPSALPSGPCLSAVGLAAWLSEAHTCPRPPDTTSRGSDHTVL